MVAAKPLIQADGIDGTDRARQWSVTLVRTVFGTLGTAVLLTVVGCVDAPITQDQLEDNGALRQGAGMPAVGGQAAFSAVEAPPTVQRAAQISAVLADVGDGPLNDRSSFDWDVGTVHLHLRADGIDEPRAVVFRWTHEPTRASTIVPGTLLPAETLRHVATHSIQPDQTGAWTVEVLSEAPGPDGIADALWQRRFEIAAPVVETVEAVEVPEASLH